MNKLSALALGTALALSLPLTAMAQDADTSVGLDAEVGVDPGEDTGVDAGLETGVDAQVGAETGATAPDAEADLSGYTYGDLDDALQGAAGADLTGITAETNIEIVTLSSLAGEGDFTAEAFTESRETYVADLGTLQSNVEDSPDILAALEAEGYVSEDVVGVWTQADGTLTVFVDDGDTALDGELTTMGTVPATDDTASPDGDDATSPDLGADGTVETETEIEGETAPQ